MLCCSESDRVVTFLYNLKKIFYLSSTKHPKSKQISEPYYIDHVKISSNTQIARSTFCSTWWNNQYKKEKCAQYDDKSFYECKK